VKTTFGRLIHKVVGFNSIFVLNSSIFGFFALKWT